MILPSPTLAATPPGRPFRDMATAPMNGVSVELTHGLNQEISRAHWAFVHQGWIRDDDVHERVLVWVTGWRPMRQTPRPPRKPAG
jgi:hypothetical protein